MSRPPRPAMERMGDYGRNPGARRERILRGALGDRESAAPPVTSKATPVGSGTPGGVVGSGWGLGPSGLPVPDVAEPHPARASTASSAGVRFTFFPRYLRVVTFVSCVIVMGSGSGANEPEILSDE